YLTPSEEDLDTAQNTYIDMMKKKATEARGSLLAMMAPLSDDTKPMNHQYNKSQPAAPSQLPSVVPEKVVISEQIQTPKTLNQKLELIKMLLTFGDTKNVIFILCDRVLLPTLHEDLCEMLCNRIAHHLEPLHEKYGIPVAV